MKPNGVTFPKTALLIVASRKLTFLSACGCKNRGLGKASADQIGFAEVRIGERRGGKIRSAQILTGKIPAGEIAAREVDLGQISVLIAGRRIELRLGNDGRWQRRLTYDRVIQIRIRQPRPGKSRPPQVGTAQVRSDQCGVDERGFRKVLVGKVPIVQVIANEPDPWHFTIRVAQGGIELLPDEATRSGIAEVGTGDHRAGQVGVGQCRRQIGIGQIRVRKIGLVQRRQSQVGGWPSFGH